MDKQIVHTQGKRLVGEGTFGQVFSFSHPIDGKSYALKIVKPNHENPDAVQLMCREVRFMAQLEHPNIIRYYGSFIDKCDSLYIQMELCQGSLADAVVQTWDSSKKIDAIAQLGRGLSYLHEISIVHRDLKPANILFRNNGAIKISDFGISVFDSEITAFDYYGTFAYTDPEIHSKKRLPDKAGDVYSVGIILVEMYLNFTTAAERTHVITLLRRNVYPCDNRIPKDILAHIMSCTSPLITRRPVATELVSVFTELKTPLLPVCDGVFSGGTETNLSITNP